MIEATAQLATGNSVVVDVARTVVLTVFAGVLGVGMGLLYRWYARTRAPSGLPILVGLSGVALYLNTAGALGEVIGGRQDLLSVDAAIFNVVTFLLAAFAASVGGRIGDRMGVSLFAVAGAHAVEADVSRIVRTVGRLTAVEIPEEIADIEGYDPVEPTITEKLAGQTLLFPRRLTVGELRERFIERLRTDYGVGHVDVDFAADATVEYLAVGSREAGIGPTLPPESAAIAVVADPPNNASPGDIVQVWAPSETDADADADAETSLTRITNAELRGTAGDITTLVMDQEVAKTLDTDLQYRLVTLPVEPRTDREFAAQLRAAEETMSVVTVEAESALVDATVGDLEVAVVALGTSDGVLEAIPPRTRAIAAGETVYAIARPDRLRKLERGGRAEATPETADGGSDAQSLQPNPSDPEGST